MHAIVVLAVLALTGVAVAQPPAQATPSIEARGAFFALSVADAAASARWYEGKLGLKPVMQTPKRDGVAVTVLEGNGLIVELIEDDKAQPLSKVATVSNPMLVHGFVKAGVVVPDFDRTLAMLKERQVEIAYGPFPARAGQRANVIVRDNAGNLIQFFGN